MGMLVPHCIGPSPIHGTGLFAAADLAEGTVLWRFEQGLETRRLLNDLSPIDQLHFLHYGYVNPLAPQWVVVCGDDARFWNFPAVGCPANAIPSDETCHGEALILAARAIAAGEELLIDPRSDADYFRKIADPVSQLMSTRWLPRVS
jgi:hypothetical protein